MDVPQEGRCRCTETRVPFYTGNLDLHGEEIHVDWLKPEMKQKLRNSLGKTSSEGLKLGCDGGASSQRPDVPVPSPLHVPLSSILDYLSALCKKQQLGEPVYLTKCVQVNPDGWMRFWYQVVIPGYPSPFRGFIWIKPDQSGLGEHEKAKNAAAFQVLKTLGESLRSLVGHVQTHSAQGSEKFRDFIFTLMTSLVTPACSFHWGIKGLLTFS